MKKKTLEENLKEELEFMRENEFRTSPLRNLEIPKLNGGILAKLRKIGRKSGEFCIYKDWTNFGKNNQDFEYYIEIFEPAETKSLTGKE